VNSPPPERRVEPAFRDHFCSLIGIVARIGTEETPQNLAGWVRVDSTQQRGVWPTGKRHCSIQPRRRRERPKVLHAISSHCALLYDVYNQDNAPPPSSWGVLCRPRLNAPDTCIASAAFADSAFCRLCPEVCPGATEGWRGLPLSASGRFNGPVGLVAAAVLGLRWTTWAGVAGSDRCL
jgi:hypothetical protein